MAYDGAAASLEGSGATASAISVSVHCPAWHGLRPAGDIALLATATGCERRRREPRATAQLYSEIKLQVSAIFIGLFRYPERITDR